MDDVWNGEQNARSQTCQNSEVHKVQWWASYGINLILRIYIVSGYFINTIHTMIWAPICRMHFWSFAGKSTKPCPVTPLLLWHETWGWPPWLAHLPSGPSMSHLAVFRIDQTKLDVCEKTIWTVRGGSFMSKFQGDTMVHPTSLFQKPVLVVFMFFRCLSPICSFFL